MESLKNPSSITSPELALVYMIDSTLATAGTMALHRERTKHEFDRQIKLAQQGITWLLQMNIPAPRYSRVEEVLRDYGGSVDSWVESFEN